MRLFPLLTLLGISLLLAPDSSALTGKVQRVPKEDEARISWDDRDALPPVGRFGMVVVGERNLALVRVADTRNQTGTVEILDSISHDVVQADMEVRLLDDSPAPPPAGSASFFVWSPRSGQPLFVDGTPAGKTPQQILLTPGSHQILMELSAGGKAGAKVKASSGESEYLLLMGKFPEARDGRGPYYLLPRNEWPKAMLPRRSRHLLWLEDGRGERIYLDCEPLKAAVVKKRVTPSYPEAARKSGVQGKVLLYALLGADGNPTEIQVIAGDHPDLSRAAAEALRQWVYQPASLDGKPVRMLQTVTVDFYLTREPGPPRKFP